MKNKIYTLSIVACCMLMAQFAGAQYINTIAGNGASGLTGDGGAATAASLGSPYGVAIDRNGNMYIADVQNYCVRKVNAAGIISTFAGTGTPGFSGDGGPATSAQMSDPTGVAVDTLGNVYIADAVNNRIRMVNTAGIITTFAGGGTSGIDDSGLATSAQIFLAFNVAADTRGNVYIVEMDFNRILKVNASGIISLVAGVTSSYGSGGDGGLAVNAELEDPYAVAVDKTGNIYIADESNNRIRKVDTNGIITTIAGTGYGQPSMATGPLTGGFTGDGGPADSAELYAPQGVAVDDSGNVYFSDTYNQRIRKVNAAGIITTIAGVDTFGFAGDGGLATLATLRDPMGLVVDAAGNIYVADDGNGRIRRITRWDEGVHQISSTASVDIYPNPSSGIFTISMPPATEVTNVSVTDVYGRIVTTCRALPGTDKVSMQFHVAPGSYIIKIENSAGCIVRKVIVE